MITFEFSHENINYGGSRSILLRAIEPLGGRRRTRSVRSTVSIRRPTRTPLSGREKWRRLAFERTRLETRRQTARQRTRGAFDRRTNSFVGARDSAFRSKRTKTFRAKKMIRNPALTLRRLHTLPRDFAFVFVLNFFFYHFHESRRQREKRDKGSKHRNFVDPIL